MSENTYMEQYLNQVILTLYLHNLLMEALNEVKEQKNAGQLKKVHELIDRVEKSGKKLALYEKVFLELMVTDYKYMMEQGWKRITRAEAIDVAINALEKQIEMKKYCDENDCADCPYYNTALKDNRCMNDFIIDKE